MKFTVGFSAALLFLLSVIVTASVSAGEVTIVGAEFWRKGDDRWSIAVTLNHNDTGWEHYADRWQVLDTDAKLLAERVLSHPHVNQQPFTRRLNNVRIPEVTKVVIITAHDKTHGWSEYRLRVDLSAAVNGQLKVVAE